MGFPRNAPPNSWPLYRLVQIVSKILNPFTGMLYSGANRAPVPNRACALWLQFVPPDDGSLGTCTDNLIGLLSGQSVFWTVTIGLQDKEEHTEQYVLPRFPTRSAGGPDKMTTVKARLSILHDNHDERDRSFIVWQAALSRTLQRSSATLLLSPRCGAMVDSAFLGMAHETTTPTAALAHSFLSTVAPNTPLDLYKYLVG